MSKKLLIIDDNEQDFKVIQRFASKLGFDEIVYAESGEEGLQKYESVRPQIVVTDTRLPGIDGFEVCKGIKGTGKDDVKVVVVTGQIDAIDAGKARESGADDYCVKTSDCEPLLNILKQLM